MDQKGTSVQRTTIKMYILCIQMYTTAFLQRCKTITQGDQE